MPSLTQTLPPTDIGFLRIVASLWGLELTASTPAEAAPELAEAMLDAELMEEVITTLPETATLALQNLFGAGGRMVWVQFARRYGDIREMGPGKRDREQPHARPNSAAETLFYRALIGKAFFDTPGGSQEFAYIPDDLLQALEFIGFEGVIEPEPQPQPKTEAEPAPRPASKAVKAPAPAAPTIAEPEYADLGEPEYTDIEDPAAEGEYESVTLPTVSAKIPPVVARPTAPPAAATPGTLGRAATPTEKAHILPATDRVLDDATTLLAALRLGIDPPALTAPTPVLTALLAASRLVSGTNLQPEAVKNFLEAPRDQALSALVEAWQASEGFNELRQLPGLAFEGGWENQPLVTREFLLNLLEPIPEGVWWSLAAFVRDIKQKYPDFQRPAGDYDTWFIKRKADGVYLRGFNHWEDVDGALVRYFIQLLYWLGQVDLATAEEGGSPTSFRLSSFAQNDEKGKIVVASNGRITVERLAPRTARYQIARFTDWETSTHPDEYRYRVTTRSLKRAAEQGLKVSQLLGLLAKHSGGQVPPVFVKALQRWETNGTEARVETLTVLKVSKPEVLNELRASKAARFLGEIIGPTTVVLQSGAEAKVMGILAELGLLAEGDIE